IQDPELLLRRSLLVAGDAMVSGGFFIPDGSRVAVLLRPLGRARMDRFPELVPVDDSAHASASLCDGIRLRDHTPVAEETPFECSATIIQSRLTTSRDTEDWG